MGVSITTKGNDFKIADGTDIKYYPAVDVQQRVIGDNVELYLDGEQFASFKSADFTTPTGTAEAISDAISDLSVVATSGGGGGGGDASASNQILEISELTDINTELDAQATATKQNDIITAIGNIGSTPVAYSSRAQATATATSSTIVSSNINRRALIINNENGEDCWISFGSTPVAEEDLKLKKNESLLIDSTMITTQDVNIICKSGKSTILTYQEGT